MRKKKPPESEKRTIGIWAKMHAVCPEAIMSFIGPEATKSTYVIRKRIDEIIKQIRTDSESSLKIHAERLRMDVEKLIKMVDPSADENSIYPREDINEIVARHRGKNGKKTSAKPKNPWRPKNIKKRESRYIIKDTPVNEPRIWSPPVKTNPILHKPVNKNRIGALIAIDDIASIPHMYNDDSIPPTNDDIEDLWDIIQRGNERSL